MRAGRVGNEMAREPRGAFRRRTASAVAVAVAAMGLGVSSAAGDGLPDASADEPVVDCAETALEATEAAELAVACGHDVEVLAERTEWDTVYAQPDGLMRLDASIAAVRTVVSGDWAPIDTSLVRTENGFEVAAAVAAMTFSDGSEGAPLVAIERDGHVMTMDMPFDLPEPRRTGAGLEYPEVLPGVDLVVTVNPDGTGFSEVLRVSTPEAAAQSELAALVLPVGLSSHARLIPSGGGFVAVDGYGRRVFTSPPPLMWDSAGAVVDAPQRPPVVQAQTVQLEEDGWRSPGVTGADARDAGPLDGDEVAVMDVDVRPESVAVLPDAEMLGDPGTVWPVYIDPSLSASLASWTTVSSAGWKHYMYTGDDGLGYCNQTSMGCSSIFRSRMMWTFGGLSLIGSLARADVVSATFSAYGTHSYSCTTYPVSAFRVGGFTANTGWPGVWYGSALSTLNITHRAACSAASQKPRWIEWNVTEALRQIADEGRNAVAIGLRDPYETTMTGWKRYRYDARLSVVYNRAPSMPTSVAMTNPTATCATGSAAQWLRPDPGLTHLTAKLVDPDGDSVAGLFELYLGGTRVWNTTSTAQVAAVHSERIPESFAWVDGARYEWRVRGRDTRGRLGPIKACEFLVDLTNPDPPVVTPVEGHPAVYLENVTTPGVNRTGWFEFGNGGSSDVVAYEYWFNNIPPGDPENPENPDGTVSATGSTPVMVPYTPDFAGEHVLYVRSIDRAANPSPVVTYAFGVAANEPITWRFDDGTGQTTTDASGGYPLTLGGATSWTAGPSSIPEGDHAIATGPSSGLVRADAGPLVATNTSFTVSAIVRLENPGASATAVSQSSAEASAFELGYVKDASCPDGCWAFQLSPGGSEAPVVTRSTLPVETGEWYLVSGTHDAVNERMRMHVCPLGTREHASAPVAITAQEAPLGAFHVAGAGSVDSPLRRWPGAISEVRLHFGPADLTQIRLTCTPAA